MQISSQFCRSQEAQQTRRAEESELANVKSIALGAAAAWRVEAVAAERREHRRTRIAGDESMVEDGAVALDSDDFERDDHGAKDPDFDETT